MTATPNVDPTLAMMQRVKDDLADAETVVARAVMERERGTDAVRQLALAAQNIASMVGLLTKIAKTTNMLALNANIEAQRLGAEGSAFAVVASEVKALAIQSMAAAAEISDVAAGLSEKAAAAVSESEGAGRTLESLLEAAGRMLGRLGSDMEKLSGCINGAKDP